MDNEKLRVTVFDLCAEDCERTARALREFFAGRVLPAEVAEFSDIAAFVLDHHARYHGGMPYDIAFVGVDSMMGAEAARAVRGIDKAMPLFFVSKMSDFALEAFRLTALDFLTKPVSQEAAAGAVARITAPCYSGHRIPGLLRKPRSRRNVEESI
jgi:DNA-binding LytR/AlgR family response regulator